MTKLALNQDNLDQEKAVDLPVERRELSTTCPSCNTKNHHAVRFCMFCGQRIPTRQMLMLSAPSGAVNRPSGQRLTGESAQPLSCRLSGEHARPQTGRPTQELAKPTVQFQKSKRCFELWQKTRRFALSVSPLVVSFVVLIYCVQLLP